MSSPNRNNHRQRELLTVSQVAELLNVHPNTVRRWAAEGSLTAYRIGRRGDRRFPRPQVVGILQGRSPA
jgi:excisionase family DNA binding protein